MGIWVVIIVILFVLGSVMALKPSGIDMRLDALRMSARKLGLNPKLVACPNWVHGKNGELGKGMIGQYGLVIDEVSLPQSYYQVINGQWRPIQASNILQNSPEQIADRQDLAMQPANSSHHLDKVALSLPPTIEPFVKALYTQANNIIIYWEDIAYVRPAHNPNYRKEDIEADLRTLKQQMLSWVAHFK